MIKDFAETLKNLRTKKDLPRHNLRTNCGLISPLFLLMKTNRECLLSMF